MTQSEELRLLISSRDISYPGGSEIFIIELIRHILSTEPHIAVSLFETDSHGAFSNNQQYDSLVNSGLSIIGDTSVRGDNLEPGKTTELRSLTKENNFDVLHSFLFVPDFHAWLSRVGATAGIRQLENLPSKHLVPDVFPLLQNISDVPAQPLSNPPHWISSKLNTFSVALEQNTQTWELRKQLCDSELEPMLSTYTDQITAVSAEGVRKWSQWSKTSVEKIPCAAVGRRDLDIIDQLELDRDEIRNRLDLSKDQHVFFTASRLVSGKGLENLISAFGQHQVSFPESVLLIAGTGELEPQLRQQIGDNGSIRLLGQLSRDQIFQCNVASDAHCLFSESEGFPLSIQEAMAAKKPILATAVGGIPELVTPNKNGRLIQTPSIPLIQASLDWAREIPPEKWASMGVASRQIIVDSFLKEHVFQELITLYKKGKRQ